MVTLTNHVPKALVISSSHEDVTSTAEAICVCLSLGSTQTGELHGDMMESTLAAFRSLILALIPILAPECDINFDFHSWPWRGGSLRGFHLTFPTMISAYSTAKDPIWGVLQLQTVSVPIIHHGICPRDYVITCDRISNDRN